MNHFPASGVGHVSSTSPASEQAGSDSMGEEAAHLSGGGHQPHPLLSHRPALNSERATSTQSPSSDKRDCWVEQTPGLAALCYARMGWHVLPIKPRSKKPIGGNGYKHATTDESIIRKWFNRCPDAGVGVALAPSGLVCVDIDPRNGGSEEGLPGAVPTTLTARTGGGGRHIIFRAAPGATYPGKLARG